MSSFKKANCKLKLVTYNGILCIEFYFYADSLLFVQQLANTILDTSGDLMVDNYQ